jgi:serine/threonine-protein kinase
MRKIHSVLACAIAVLVPSVAFADGASRDSASAQALFEEGKRLMNAGDFAVACPKLAESHRLDPSGGTMLHLALCHMKEGKTATAWLEFNQALSTARRDRRADRETFARARIAELEPRLSRLTVAVDSVARVDGLVVKRDATPIGEATWGQAVPVDPGEHDVTASAPGKKTWSTKVTVKGDGARTAIVVPALEAEASAAPALPASPAPMAAPPASVAVEPAPAPPIDASSWSARKTMALVVGGVGVAGLAVGGVFGLVSKSKHDDADTHCKLGPSGNACDATGVSLDADAVSAGNISTVAFGAGAAALVTGVVLWLTAPSPSSVTVGVGPAPRGAAGLSLHARW